MKSIVLSDTEARDRATRHFFNRALREVREGIGVTIRGHEGVNGGAKLVHPGGAKLVHLMLCGTRCWGLVPVVHRRDPRCFV